jgi:GNAT superfamily N-acetyltransferase
VERTGGGSIDPGRDGPTPGDREPISLRDDALSLPARPTRALPDAGVETDKVATEIIRLSDHPGRVDSARALLREYILLPDGWEVLGPVPLELPDLFATEFGRFPGPAAPPTGEVLLATDGPAVVGLGEIVPMEGDSCEFKRVYMVAERQGLGIGKLLARALLDEARNLGYLHVVLDVLPSRQRARSLWTSVGFGEVDSYRAYPFLMVFMGRALSTLQDAPGW